GARRQDDVRQRPVRRHDHRSANGNDVVGNVAVSSAARVEEARELPGRVVPHEHAHVVPATSKRGRLVLRVLDDATPVGPRERNDDADLHAGAAANARRSRSAPRSIVSSPTASESRAQPAPLGPKPSPGATATRSSASSRSAVTPSGSRIHTKKVPSQTGGSGSVAARTSRRRS